MLSSYTKTCIAQQYYVRKKLRVWARRSHHGALHNLLPSKLIFNIKPESGHIVSDHVYRLYAYRIFNYQVKLKIIEGNVRYKM